MGKRGREMGEESRVGNRGKGHGWGRVNVGNGGSRVGKGEGLEERERE